MNRKSDGSKAQRKLSKPQITMNIKGTVLDPKDNCTISTGLELAMIPMNQLLKSKGDQQRTKNGKWTLQQLRATDGIVPLQSGTNQFDSQKGTSGFGMPRDVKGKHLKRLWELEFPEEGDRVYAQKHEKANK